MQQGKQEESRIIKHIFALSFHLETCTEQIVLRVQQRLFSEKHEQKCLLPKDPHESIYNRFISKRRKIVPDGIAECINVCAQKRW